MMALIWVQMVSARVVPVGVSVVGSCAEALLQKPSGQLSAWHLAWGAYLIVLTRRSAFRRESARHLLSLQRPPTLQPPTLQYPAHLACHALHGTARSQL